MSVLTLTSNLLTPASTTEWNKQSVFVRISARNVDCLFSFHRCRLTRRSSGSLCVLLWISSICRISLDCLLLALFSWLLTSGREDGTHAPVYINSAEVASFEFPGVNITSSLSWSYHVETMDRETHQCLYFCRKLKNFSMSPQGSLEDPELELHAGFGSLREWDPFSGLHDWPLFGMTRGHPERRPSLWKPNLGARDRQVEGRCHGRRPVCRQRGRYNLLL
ncbi:uncharacterized protein LOC132385487 [Hypanus sabinus]|uniref:uncharacterized protein LOC132385487 n=1 Tax=Hypanus sabinus TaxID=79690 RepID=UPI0028C4219E|nr:uncharacterized protein LOC132385487 [Hypanus sabinus]